MEDSEAQLQLKKRARRRLVGAIFFVSLVALVLPMVMDSEPRQAVQDVEIRIPGQDEKSFAPKFAATQAPKAAEVPVVKPAEIPLEKPVDKAAVATDKPAVAGEAKASAAAKPTARVLEVVQDGKTVDKAPEKPVAKPEKPSEKPVEKTAAKPADKATDKAAAEKAKADEAKRASALLSGQGDAKPAAKGGEHLILIGAFSNEANVKNLREKLSEQGIKTFVEPLDTPQGKKTRVRAGPFASREAADKALEKMQRIGVSGVVAAKP